jgi:nicotinamide mononucleotide adenylyltransferase
MVKLALKDSDWIILDTWESQQNDWTKTLIALNYYQEKYSKTHGNNVQLMLLCGADLIESFNVPNLWLDEHVIFQRKQVKKYKFFVLDKTNCSKLWLSLY